MHKHCHAGAPAARTLASATVVGDMLYLYGGYLQLPTTPTPGTTNTTFPQATAWSNQLAAFNLTLGAWVTSPVAAAATADMRLQEVALGGGQSGGSKRLFMFGGNRLSGGCLPMCAHILCVCMQCVLCTAWPGPRGCSAVASDLSQLVIKAGSLDG